MEVYFLSFCKMLDHRLIIKHFLFLLNKSVKIRLSNGIGEGKEQKEAAQRKARKHSKGRQLPCVFLIP